MKLPTQDEVKRCLDYDPVTGKFIRKIIQEITSHHKMLNARFGGKEAGARRIQGHIEIFINGKHYLAHRLAWVCHYGGNLDNERIIHINADLSDNRIINLKSVSVKKRIKPVPSIHSVYKGVYRIADKKWYSQITSRGRVQKLGPFNTEREAARAYNKAATELHGHFAELNKI